ncbi:MAG: outer membrane protein assembly factor BamA [Sphingomonadales bacterium]|nr:outer membrane protein assembly factor BamA [Sphingomonadales bacterium]
MGQGSGAARMTRWSTALLATSVLAGLPAIAVAQVGAAPAPAVQTPAAATAPAASPAAATPAPAPQEQIIQSLAVEGAQRLEPDTVLSFVKLRVGQPYSGAAADQALKDLYATELFSDAQVRNDNGRVTITVKENPVINRIIMEGNKNLKDDKITPEIKLAPRQIFTRSKVRADVARIIELYKRQGRFGATVEPKMVMLDQNRVDIIFEISEGPKSKVRQINIIGNTHFSAKQLDAAMLTHQARPLHLFTGGTSYDPDRMAYDQQKLRQFYLTNGYADFRVVSAEAELTPDKRDFIITYVVEEGKRYKFGPVKVESQLRGFDSDALTKALPMKKGDWYNAKLVEDTIDRLNEGAGAYGYAFADTRPDYQRDPKTLTMAVTFDIGEAPRVYVQRIDINGNTLTEDKVIRREFRLAEGDAFNSLQVKRSTNRIKSLGYFQEKFEVAQKPGEARDRVILEANVEEKPTGELQLSAGYSSLEGLIFQASIQQRNFQGRGQTLGLSGSISAYSKSIDLGFTEPYLFDRNVALGIDLYRRDYNNFNYGSTNNNSIYSQSTTGFQVRLGLPLTEYLSLVNRYTLNYDQVFLNPGQFYDNNGPNNAYQCDPLLAGRYLCEAQGSRVSSIIGTSLVYDNVDNRAHPSKGRVLSAGADVAGFGGSVAYVRERLSGSQYIRLPHGFIYSLSVEGGAIEPLKSRNVVGDDNILLTDRFYLGEPQIRGFDIRGVGPRVVRKPYLLNAAGQPVTDNTGNFVINNDKYTWQDDAIGGRYYYLSRAEVEIPLGAGAKELGIRPSIFLDAGAVWGVVHPQTQQITSTVNKPVIDTATGKPLYYQVNSAGQQVLNSFGVPVEGDSVTSFPVQTTVQPFQEFFYGDTALPRIAIGVGFNWNSPFGPFRIDIAKSLLHALGDDTKVFTFNVGTQF